MNKYEIAAKLDAAGARAWFIQRAFEGRDLSDLFVHAASSLASAEQAAECWRKDIAAIRAVLAEIEAEEKPAEPEVSIDSDAPCANPDGCEGPPAHENFMRAHNPEKCDGARPWCHPYRAPEPSYDGPRYASGEQPMVGDIVCSDFGLGGEMLYFAFLRPGRYHGLDARFLRELYIDEDLLTLVRRAEVAK